MFCPQNLYRASSSRGLASRRTFQNPVQSHLGHLYPPPQQRQLSPFPQPWGAGPRQLLPPFSSSDLSFKPQVWHPGNLHSTVPGFPRDPSARCAGKGLGMEEALEKSSFFSSFLSFAQFRDLKAAATPVYFLLLLSSAVLESDPPPRPPQSPRLFPSFPLSPVTLRRDGGLGQGFA